MREVLAQPKRVALLAYLVVEGQRVPVPRDRLLALFWPESDEARARNALSQALHHLRQALGTDVTAFADAWLADIGAGVPVRQGPLPDPPGPLPAGWSSSPAPAAAQPPAGSTSAPSTGGASSGGGSSPPLPPPSSAAAATLPAASSILGALGSPAPAATPDTGDQQQAGDSSGETWVWVFGLLALVLGATGIGRLLRGRGSAAR